MPRLEVESSYRFLYLRQKSDEVYLGYDYDGMVGLIEDHGVENCYLLMDAKGERHMLVISPKLSCLTSEAEKEAVGSNLCEQYRRQLRLEREQLLLFKHVNT